LLAFVGLTILVVGVLFLSLHYLFSKATFIPFARLVDVVGTSMSNVVHYVLVAVVAAIVACYRSCLTLIMMWDATIHVHLHFLVETSHAQIRSILGTSQLVAMRVLLEIDVVLCLRTPPVVTEI